MYSLFRGNVSCFLGTYYTPADEKVKVVYCKKTFFWGARCLAGYFGPLLADLFGHGPVSPLPQSVPRKNPNYIRDTSAPFLDRWLNCASLVCHWRQVSVAKLSRPRVGCFAPRG